MDNMDLELANLLRTEKHKVPFYCESIEPERRQVVGAFYDHLTTLRSMEGDLTFEGFMQAETVLTDEEANESQEEEEARLNELIQTDLERYPLLGEGEMKVSGEGAYMMDTEEKAFVGVLDLGETIHGTVDHYSVAPLVSIDDEGDVAESAPTLWVELNDATVFDAAGKIVASSDRMLAPFTLSSLYFEKVIRSGDAVVGSVEQLQIEDVNEQLSGSDFQELANDVEADLNHNVFDTDEERVRAHREHHEALSEQVQSINFDDVIVLSVSDAIIPAGDPRDITSIESNYNGPAIIKIYNSWRVVHSFSLIDADDAMGQMIFAFPEAIKKALIKRK